MLTGLLLSQQNYFGEHYSTRKPEWKLRPGRALHLWTQRHFRNETRHCAHTTSPRYTSLSTWWTVKGKGQREATAVVKDQEKRSDLHFQWIVPSGCYEDLPPLTKSLLSDSNSPPFLIRFAQFFKEQTSEWRVVLCPGLLLLVVPQFLGGVHSPR